MSHKDYLNESIQQFSSDDEDDMGADDSGLVAEERKSFTTVHQTQANQHPLLNSTMDNYRLKRLQEEEVKGNGDVNTETGESMGDENFQQSYELHQQLTPLNLGPTKNDSLEAYDADEYNQFETIFRYSEAEKQNKLERQEELEESKGSSPRGSGVSGTTGHKNVKFILFNQNATLKKKQDSHKPTTFTSITK
jgi:hypothetical protein